MKAKSHSELEAEVRAAWLRYRAGDRKQLEAVTGAAVAAGHVSLVLCLARVELAKTGGRPGEALDWYRKALALAPDEPKLPVEVAQYLDATGDPAQAVAVLTEALQRLPDAVPVLQALGLLLVKLGRPGEAVAHLRRAAGLAPRDPRLHTHLGIAHFQVADYDEAAAAFRAGLALAPSDISLLNNLAATLRMQDSPAEAERIYRRIMQVAPAYPDAPSNLGSLLRESGRIGEAKEMFRRALKLKSPWPSIHSNLIFCLDFDTEGGLEEQIAERARWRQAVEAPLAARRCRHEGARDPAKRLRIGYVSADFRVHSASDMFGGVLLNHDLKAFDIHLYSAGSQEDARTALFRQHATAFTPIRGLPDEAVASRIQADGIDILVDLSGHSAGNRLPVFALKPAPLQVTAWGYATGTGLSSIDIFLADPWLIPAALRPRFSERIVDLPCFLTYRPPEHLPPCGPLPAAAQEGPTFGCLNRLAKASEACLQTWAELLRRIDAGRLILKCPSLEDAGRQARVRRIFEAAGIAPGRLDLRGRTSHAEHLQTYHEIDIALDPFPHCGGTTTCEALAMGLPVVSLCGEVPVARNGLSLLSALGHPEWVASDREGYLATAVALAADRERLQALRAGLRGELMASPLGDNVGYARAVERIYREVWRAHCLPQEAGGNAPPA